MMKVYVVIDDDHIRKAFDSYEKAEGYIDRELSGTYTYTKHVDNIWWYEREMHTDSHSWKDCACIEEFEVE